MLRIRYVPVHPRILIFPSRIQGQKDSGSASKNLNIFNPKNCFQALGNMIRDFQPRAGYWFFADPGSRIPDAGVRKAQDPGSRTAALPVLYACKLIKEIRRGDQISFFITFISVCWFVLTHTLTQIFFTPTRISDPGSRIPDLVFK